MTKTIELLTRLVDKAIPLRAAAHEPLTPKFAGASYKVPKTHHTDGYDKGRFAGAIEMIVEVAVAEKIIFAPTADEVEDAIFHRAIRTKRAKYEGVGAYRDGPAPRRFYELLFGTEEGRLLGEEFEVEHVEADKVVAVARKRGIDPRMIFERAREAGHDPMELAEAIAKRM